MTKYVTRMAWASCGCIALALAGSTAAQQDYMYELKDLGSLGGDTVATAVNVNGQVVGWSQVVDLPIPQTHAFFWENEKMVDIGTLGGGFSAAYDVNRFGEVVGASTTAEGDMHAFYYLDGEMHDLNEVQVIRSTPLHTGLLMPLPKFQEAFAINDMGWIIGRGTLFNDTWERAYMLVPTLNAGPGNMMYYYIDLGTLPHSSDSAAYDIAGQPYVVGESGSTAFLYAAEYGGPIYLDPEWLSRRSAALGVNNRGQAVGWSAPIGSFVRTAALWQDGYRIDLSAGPGWATEACDITNSGMIVGKKSRMSTNGLTPIREERAVLWLGYELPIDLNDVTNFGPQGKARWDSFEVAYEILDNGFIVGSGRYRSGYSGAFLLVPNQDD